MKVRCYTEVVDRILAAVGKSEHLIILHTGHTTFLTENSLELSYPLYCLCYISKQTNAPLIYVSAGIHGDEPAGVECAVRLLELLVDGDKPPDCQLSFDAYNWIVSPCDNPYGYERDCRENAEGFDLNRMFDFPHQSVETAFITETFLKSDNPFQQEDVGKKYRIQLALDLHEDKDSDGFYLWERRASDCPPIGSSVVIHVAELCAINSEPLIEDHVNKDGVITLLNTVTTKGWTRGRYLIERVNTPCLILETPTTLDYEKRISIHMKAIESAVKEVVS